MKATELLDTASRLITGARQEKYGDAEESFTRIATLWSAYTGYGFVAADVPMMMALLKIARNAPGPHEDSLVDPAGYAALAAELNEPPQAEVRGPGMNPVPPRQMIDEIRSTHSHKGKSI